MCIGLSVIPTKNEKKLSRFSKGNWKIRSRPHESSLNTTIGIASGSHGSRAEKTDNQVTQKDELLQFWSESTTVHSSRRKQQVFKANRGAEILYTTDVSLWKHIGGINNPADIGTRGVV